MLSIGKIASGPQAAAYYTDQVARGRDDYWAGEGEVPGQWTGTGASSLGLTGEVDADRLTPHASTPPSARVPIRVPI